jgi:hypothetical protein
MLPKDSCELMSKSCPSESFNAALRDRFLIFLEEILLAMNYRLEEAFQPGEIE